MLTRYMGMSPSKTPKSLIDSMRVHGGGGGGGEAECDSRRLFTVLLLLLVTAS